jgi:hypothetical protein
MGAFCTTTGPSQRKEKKIQKKKKKKPQLKRLWLLGASENVMTRREPHTRFGQPALCRREYFLSTVTGPGDRTSVWPRSWMDIWSQGEWDVFFMAINVAAQKNTWTNKLIQRAERSRQNSVPTMHTIIFTGCYTRRSQSNNTTFNGRGAQASTSNF